MKKLLLLSALLIFAFGYGQVDVTDLGKKSFSEVKNSFSIPACEVTNNEIITYCIEDGSRLSFLFKNRVLNGIMTMQHFQLNILPKENLNLKLKGKNLQLELNLSLLTVKLFLIRLKVLFLLHIA